MSAQNENHPSTENNEAIAQPPLLYPDFVRKREYSSRVHDFRADVIMQFIEAKNLPEKCGELAWKSYYTYEGLFDGEQCPVKRLGILMLGSTTFANPNAEPQPYIRLVNTLFVTTDDDILQMTTEVVVDEEEDAVYVSDIVTQTSINDAVPWYQLKDGDLRISKSSRFVSQPFVKLKGSDPEIYPFGRYNCIEDKEFAMTVAEDLLKGHKSNEADMIGKMAMPRQWRSEK